MKSEEHHFTSQLRQRLYYLLNGGSKSLLDLAYICRCTLVFSCTATATTLVLPRDYSYPIHAPRFAADIVWRVHAQNTSYVRPSDGGKVL